MKTAALSFVALTCSCANAFTVSTASLRTQARGRSGTAASSTSLRMGWSLKEEDFIPSEEWLGEYLAEQGLRYKMDKTPQEIEKEGDYTLLQKLFGQTSNNDVRMKLKEEVLAKANTPTNPSLYKSWTAKYGYGRFFPVYVDKSGLSEDSPDPASQLSKEYQRKPAGKSIFNALGGPTRKDVENVPARASSKASAKAAPKAAAKKAARAAPQAAKKVANAAPKAAKKVVKEAKAAPKAAAKAVKKAAPKEVKKAMGNIGNLPKAL